MRNCLDTYHVAVSQKDANIINSLSKCQAWCTGIILVNTHNHPIKWALLCLFFINDQNEIKMSLINNI